MAQVGGQEGTGVRGQVSGVGCQGSGVGCQVSGVRGQVSGVRCQGSGVGCQVSGVRCQVSGVRCQGSGVRCQVSGVRCQVSGVRGQVSGVGDLKIRRTRDIIEAVEKGLLPDKIMINVHPQRWTDDYVPWVKELVAQNFKNIVKKRMIALRQR